ncbi:MAG: sarcosine oxidase subunit beta [Halobacteriales archaeon]|jgi:sarcosine oxidase subunit beta
MTAADAQRIAVVGGGVIGCAAAAALAPDYDVVLFESDRIAGGATGRSAGLVTVEPAFSDSPSIADRAMSEFERFDEEGRVVFHAHPSLEPVPADERAIARRRLDRLQGAGVSVDWLNPDEVAARYPLRIDGHAGALLFQEAGWVDPHELTQAYRRKATEAGATIEVGTTVQEIVTTDDAVVAVETDRGRKSVETVVVAAGWATPELVGPFVDLPTRAYRTQCVRIEGSAALGTCPLGWTPTIGCYFRPDGNGLLVGGMPSFVEEPGSASRMEDVAFRRHVATVFYELLAIDASIRIANGWAGIDLATPDGRPIIDAPDKGPTGLLVASGFHGRGIMTAPVVGTLIRQLVADDADTIPETLFGLDRFGTVADDFGVPGITEA